MGQKITYGSSLEALRFSCERGTKIILEDPTFPAPYEDKARADEWAKLYFEVLLSGAAIGGDSVMTTHVGPEEVQIVCKGNVVNKISYEALYAFSDKNIIGLPAPQTLSTFYTVVDRLEPLSLSVPHVSFIETADRLVQQLHIQKRGPTQKPELYAISSLTQKELHDFDFSDTIVRFKCEDLLRQNGFKGAANGKHKRALKLASTSRDVVTQMHHYKNTEKIKFFNGS
jgi:hypothetical protein